MYYDDNNVKLKIDWKSLILKLVLVILVVLLIIWVFPMPKLDTFYNKVYNDNLNTMKEASENYFTNEKLPSNTGDSVTIKLQDMLDKKLITTFTDKNNNQCSTTNSFAQVTKTDNSNYVLKVQLSCDEKTDYILENLDVINNSRSTKSSSNSQSNSNNSENDADDSEDDGIEIDQSILDEADSKYDKDAATVEYQYKKAITKTSTSYTCPEGYVKDNNVCYKYETGETINATPLYFDDVVVSTDAKKNTTGSYTKTANVVKNVEKTEKVCPEGYTLNGNICYKYTNVTVVPGTTTYTCPDGYVLNGTKCTRTIDVTRTTTSGSTYYTCDNGGYLDGTTCKYSASYRSGSSSSYCPSGYSDNGGNCVKTVAYTGTYHAATTTYGNCPSGYSTNGNLCYYSATQTKTWSNPTVQTSRTQLSVYDNGSSKRVLVNGSSACTLSGCNYIYYYYTATIKYSCSRGETPVDGYCMIYRPVNTTSAYYTCNDGTKQSSSTCYTKSYTSKITSSSSGSYYCPNGGSLDGTTCKYSATYHRNSDVTSTTCPAGYTQSGNNCIYTIDATKNTTATEYTCPTGYVREGTTCYQYTEPTTKTTYNYTCPEGFTKNGEGESTTCTKKVESTTTLYCENDDEKLVDGKCVKTIKGGLRGYSCPSGYILNKDKCVKKTLECMAPQEVTNTSTTYEYKWSTEESLDGWTQTGKTRTTGSSSSNVYEK